MKVGIAIAAVGLAGTSIATAADMRPPAAAPAVVRSAPACAQFGGLYLGAHGGGVFYHIERRDDDALFGAGAFTAATSTATRAGAVAGAQAGYNWQVGCALFGIETDGSWSSAKARFDFLPNAGVTRFIESDLQWLGTTRGRVGVVVSDLLLYLTGGVAYGSVKNRYVAQPLFDFTRTHTRVGWTAGVGGEWSLGGGWSVRSEAFYVQFTSQRDTLVLPNFIQPTNRFTNDDSAWVGRLGLNYTFGGPVVARY